MIYLEAHMCGRGTVEHRARQLCATTLLCLRGTVDHSHQGTPWLTGLLVWCGTMVPSSRMRLEPVAHPCRRGTMVVAIYRTTIGERPTRACVGRWRLWYDGGRLSSHVRAWDDGHPRTKSLPVHAWDDGRVMAAYSIVSSSVYAWYDGTRDIGAAHPYVRGTMAGHPLRSCRFTSSPVCA
jgi:hypothetical protein